MQMKFHAGVEGIVWTPGARRAFIENQAQAMDYLDRHFSGDWGNVDSEDAETNNAAIENGTRIVSSYLLPDGTKIWIITDGVIDDEGNRYATTILLPEEY